MPLKRDEMWLSLNTVTVQQAILQNTKYWFKLLFREATRTRNRLRLIIDFIPSVIPKMRENRACVIQKIVLSSRKCMFVVILFRWILHSRERKSQVKFDEANSSFRSEDTQASLFSNKVAHSISRQSWGMAAMYRLFHDTRLLRACYMIIMYSSQVGFRRRAS